MSIHQEVIIKAPAQEIYDALVDGPTFSRMTGGAPATIDAEAGGAFSLFGGAIAGRQIELVPGRRVVQAWRVGSWPEGLYSLVRFELQAQGQETKITFDHVGYPDAETEHLSAGWSANYWEPLQKLLA
jgi:activator of HSP90 ATPase